MNVIMKTKKNLHQFVPLVRWGVVAAKVGCVPKFSQGRRLVPFLISYK